MAGGVRAGGGAAATGGSVDALRDRAVPTGGDIEALQDAVLAWFAEHGRDLPWRRTRDPYAILVSEVMLQQTQVARVVERYERWLVRWPDEPALAAASPADVLTEWVGLGYNARALRLREAAAVIVRDGWPRTARELRALPGVGPYTAAAVASFAFGEEVAAVDVNTARVAKRLGQGTAEELLPRGRAEQWNQAAMELGALVCRARSVACDACPAAAWCASRGMVPGPRGGAVVARPTGPPGPASALGGGAGADASGAVAVRVRFEDTNRWVRGRIVAALAAGEPLPAGLGAARLDPALLGLERDGLIERDGAGWRLPRRLH